MNNTRLYSTPFCQIYALYVAKATRKNRNEEEVRHVVQWLTGYSEEMLNHHLTKQISVSDFFAFAPMINERSLFIHGVICKVNIDTIADPLMKKIRCLDKMIDDLAKGKSIGSIIPNEPTKEEN